MLYGHVDVVILRRKVAIRGTVSALRGIVDIALRSGQFSRTVGRGAVALLWGLTTAALPGEEVSIARRERRVTTAPRYATMDNALPCGPAYVPRLLGKVESVMGRGEMGVDVLCGLVTIDMLRG